MVNEGVFVFDYAVNILIIYTILYYTIEYLTIILKLIKCSYTGYNSKNTCKKKHYN